MVVPVHAARRLLSRSAEGALVAVGGLALGLAAASGVSAQQIVIDDPRDKSLRVAVQAFRPARPGAEETAAAIERALDAGLDFAGLFDEVDPKAFLGPRQSPPMERGDPVVCPNWRQIGADALIRAEVETSGGAVRTEFELIDVSRGCKSLLRKRYRGTPDDVPRMGRAMADDVVGAFTGRPGVADTELAFVSTRTGAKEIHVMTADGSALRAATTNRSINSFPDWSPDGESIVYTSYRYRARPQLFLLTRGRKSPGRILRGLDASNPIYRGVFAPDGDTLGLVRSVSGASEIFTVRRDGSDLRRLTNSRAIEVSPSFSPDGNRIAFVSDRTGSPQVYVMNRDGSGVRRLTFNGGYNTSPAWSPDGRWIAYESRARGQFDIWLIDPEGRSNTPLVTHGRSDEHPTWSPDSRMLAFSSTRRGRAQIFVVDLNGGNLRQVTQEGENTGPSWGPYRR